MVQNFSILSILLVISPFLVIQGQIDPTPLRVLAGDLGWIQGAYVQTIDEPTTYISFHGIPYAKYDSYMGQNRFQPSEVWEGQLPVLINDTWPFLALNPLIYCPQNSLIFPEDRPRSWDFRRILKYSNTQPLPSEAESKLAPGFIGQEDCLVLNVNTPRIPNDGDPLLPVMVYIHGGGFDIAWGSLFNGMRFMRKDIIYITINYRLGALGSLNLGTDSAPGNAGLYDSKTALDWVQKYVHHFGGDPTKVTIAGFSAGADMVTHLMLSPLTKDLIHGAIAASGSALNIWGTTDPSLPAHLRVSYYADCYDGVSEPDIEAITQCMKDKPVEDLIRAADAFKASQEHDGTGTGYEGNAPSVQSSPDITIPKIIPEHPLNVLLEGRQHPIPFMSGATRHDGTTALPTLINNYLIYNDLINNTEFMRHDLVPTFLRAFNLEIGPTFSNSVARTFLGDAKDTGDFDSKMPGLIDLCTVFAFKAGTLSMVEMNSKVHPDSYYYNFEFMGSWKIQDLIGDTTVVPGGIGHGDDALYLFQFLPFVEDVDMQVSRRMTDYYVNFMYYGNPNGDVDAEEVWPRYDPDTLPYLSINAKDEVKFDPRTQWIGNAEELFGINNSNNEE